VGKKNAAVMQRGGGGESSTVDLARGTKEVSERSPIWVAGGGWVGMVVLWWSSERGREPSLSYSLAELRTRTSTSWWETSRAVPLFQTRGETELSLKDWPGRNRMKDVYGPRTRTKGKIGDSGQLNDKEDPENR